MSFLTEVGEARLIEPLYLLELQTRDPVSEAVSTTYAASRPYHAPPGDSLAPNRYYPGGLEPPSFAWQLFAGERTSGFSAPPGGQLVLLDLEGVYAAIAGHAVEGLDQVLRVGGAGVDLADFAEIHLRAARLHSDGDRHVVELGHDTRFDQPVPRRRLWGLGACVELSPGDGRLVSIADDPSLDLTGGFSLEVVVELKDTGTFQPLVVKGNLSDLAWFLYRASDDRVAIRVRDTLGATKTAYGPDIPLGVRTRVHARWDGADLQSGVNGSWGSALAFSGPLDTNAHDVTVGKQPAAHINPAHGKFDDVRIWNVARSDSEISRFYDRELPPEEWDDASLVCYLRFNEGTGGSAADESSLENDATITGSVWTSLLEGEPGERQLVPIAGGRRRRVPGVWVSRQFRILQLHDGAARSIGPGDEGLARLNMKVQWTAADISFDATAKRVRTAGAVDFSGLVKGQFVKVTGSSSNDGTYRLLLDSAEGWLRTGSLVAESAGASITVETAGGSWTATDISFTAASKKISNAGSVTFFGLEAGQTVTVAGTASNDGVYTLASDSTQRDIVVVEALVDEAAGPSVSVTANELFDYKVDLANSQVLLEAEPTLPVAFGLKAIAPGGSTYVETRGALIERVALGLAGLAAGEIDSASIAAADAVDAAPCGFYLGQETPTVRALLDRLAAPRAAWGPAFGSGKLEVEIVFKTPAVLAFSAEDALGDLFAVDTPNARPPVRRVELLWGENDLPLGSGDVAGIASADSVALGEAEWLEASSPEVDVAGHPDAAELVGLETPYQTLDGAQGAAEVLGAREAALHPLVRTTTSFQPFVAEPRRLAATLTSDRVPALGGGKTARLLSLELDGPGNRVRATWWIE